MTALNSTNKSEKCFSLESGYLGLYDYERAVQLQNELYQLVIVRNQFSIIGLEHPAVLTLGHRFTAQSESVDSEIPIIQSSRGGLATIHSEGQLIIYPIINLRELNWGVKQYVQILLETTQTLLSDLNIESVIDEQSIGLHTTLGKIAFCGIQVKNGITLHGLSLNVKNDLELFSTIKACGIENPALDQLRNYDVDLTLSELFSRWIKIFTNRILQ